MNTLYHGSYTKVEKPRTDVGRCHLDFGRGFYVTNLQAQAEKWAIVVGSRHNDDENGTVSIYVFDDTALQAYHVLRFPEYDIHWLDFVVANRQGDDAAKGYDAVEGGVADDQVIDTVEDYETGRITAEQALDQLHFKKPNHQLCIRNQEIIDKHLRFTESYTVKY